eukprot:CAMPEP_0181336782 /NCGR_PEP_ID=MMETSP1101-20121128/27623_1 /TAXON_ID=46948 /ORGANISM="Rhodomonas abbreviata, Strain Caron Lab Isolate" /LENGTH=311 /DNA_ID=CAMNT_0023447141 /DNA_START=82 /DNA_END=1017 /DNA_ORIENTATION=-
MSTRMKVYGPSKETFVTCDCGCNESTLVVSIQEIHYVDPNEGPSQEFLDKFHLEPIQVITKGGKSKKKTADSSSKATTPTKESAQEDNDNEEKKEIKKVTKKQKTSEPKAKATKEDDDDMKIKKPPSAFILFCNAFRDEERAKNKEATLGAIQQALGARWKALSEEDKNGWNQKAEKAKVEHVEKFGLSESEKKKQAKAEKPRGPRSSYFIFMAEKRTEVVEQNPSLAPKEVATKLGLMWKDLTAEEKAVYTKMAEEEKATARGGADMPAAGTKRKAEDEEKEDEAGAEEEAEEKAEDEAAEAEEKEKDAE